jgi:ribosomal protein S18 acetylase RimI-like enzyme
MQDELLARVDRYLHAVPLSGATAIPVGPFTLFRTTTAWPYYARPAGPRDITAGDVEQLRDTCDRLEVPLSIEWVVQICPSMGPAAAAAGLEVVEHPLLVVEPDTFKPAAGVDAMVLAGSDLIQARAVAEVAFGNPTTAIGGAGPAARDAAAQEIPAALAQAQLARAEAGVTVTVGVSGEDGLVASGQHQPVDGVSEIGGVATLPSMRRRGLAAAVTSALVEDAFSRGVELVLLSAQSDAVAAVYERVGFRRIGSAGAAE